MKLSALSLILLMFAGCKAPARAQATNEQGSTISSIKLFRAGDHTSFPSIRLNSEEVLQLVFDDLDNSNKNYYYTYQLCNADWTPSMLSPFEYIRGFQNNRISTYRNSSNTSVPYIHYQAVIPDRSSAPTRAGNYLLKVFLDNDTSKLVFTRRFVTTIDMANIAVRVQEPFNARLYKSFQKLNIVVTTDKRLQALRPDDLKVVVVQNNNWQTSLYMDRPTIYRGNYFEYSDESINVIPAGSEFRWIDLRSLRLMSDRMQDLDKSRDTTQVYMKTDRTRRGHSYYYYRDLNGSYTIENTDYTNPFWQSDYALVHLSYATENGEPIPGQDLYVFGEMTNWGTDESAKMVFNKERGIYERSFLLKQGYYNYNYATKPVKGKSTQLDFSQTEGDFSTTENSYTVLVYVRPFGARADELIGIYSVSTLLQTPIR